MLPDIPHQEVSISALGDEFFSGFHKPRGKFSGVYNDLLAVITEFLSSYLLELNRKGANLVVVRASLEHLEDGKVDLLSKFLLAKDDT